LAQKKEVARHIFEREPGRTANSVAEEVGLSQPTAQKVQDEVEAAYFNGVDSLEQSYVGARAQGGGRDPVGAPAPGEEMPPAPERVEVTGRKARGRKPLSPVEKAVRAHERRQAKLAQKEAKLKPLTSARDDEVDTIAQQVGGNLKLLPDIVEIISG